MSLAELARAAGYAAPSLYRYFGSKEEIFASLLAMVSAEVEEAAARALALVGYEEESED